MIGGARRWQFSSSRCAGKGIEAINLQGWSQASLQSGPIHAKHRRWRISAHDPPGAVEAEVGIIYQQPEAYRLKESTRAES